MKKSGFLTVLSLALVLGLTACGETVQPTQSSSKTTQESSSVEQSSSEASSSSIQEASSSNQTTSSAQKSSSSEQKSSSSQASSISSSVSSSSSKESSSSQASSSSQESSSIHVHVYGDLVEEVLPSWSYDGKKAHYRCSECQQYFDVNKNPVTEESLRLPRAGENIAVSVNGVQKGVFTNVSKDNDYAVWKYESLTVAVDDVITITKPGDATYRYSYFGNGNVDKDGKILTAGTVNLDLSANANGFHLEVSGYKYPGLVVKVNDNEYPLTKVSYYEENKETYIYGYHYFNVGDKMTVVDNVNNVVYDYDDLESDTTWDIFDFHKGTNNEIVFDYQARFGIEFDRAGDKLISITKAFAPNAGKAFQVNYSSDKAAVDLEKMVIGETHELYDELSWYLKNDVVINNGDMVEYVNTNGFELYQKTINFSQNEMFNINNVTSNSIVTGSHLAQIYSESTESFVTLDGDYIKVLKDASITVVYAPFYDVISLYISASSSTDGAYVYFGGQFIPVEINNNVIEYNRFHADQYDTIAFYDAGYHSIEFTLAAGYDSSVFYVSSSMLMIFKAGTFNLSLDLTTHILTATIVELDGQTQDIVPAYLSGKGGLFKTLVDNPENPDELYATGVDVTNVEDSFYLAFYDRDYNSVEGITLDTDSAAYGTVMLGKMIYMSQNGTYNIYINKTSYVVRLVKTA